LIQDSELRGDLKAGRKLIEPTSGKLGSAQR